VLVSLLIALSLAVPGDLPPPPPPAPGAVGLRGGGFYGAGILWDEVTVLTALHVVEDMPEVRVTLLDGVERRAAVVDRDPALDLALLRLEGGPAGLPAPPRAARPPAAGALVRLLGCPRDRCGGEVLGAVLAPLWRFAGGDYLRIAAAVEPGASGGPVLDADGAVVGIVDLALLAPGGVALAVPIAAAERRFGTGALALARAAR
jgi:S1-C subfamily serine protease